jgi:uncharacterized protein
MKLAQLHLGFDEQSVLETLANNDAVAIELYRDAGWSMSDALFSAIKAGNLQAATASLDHGADPNAVNKEGDCPLHLAAGLGRYEIVRLLLRKKAKIDTATASYGQTPLFNAVMSKQVPIAETLLEAGADVNGADGNGANGKAVPIYWAAVAGDERVIELLLKYHPKIPARDERGFLPSERARANNHPKAAQLLSDYEQSRSR